MKQFTTRFVERSIGRGRGSRHEGRSPYKHEVGPKSTRNQSSAKPSCCRSNQKPSPLLGSSKRWHPKVFGGMYQNQFDRYPTQWLLAKPIAYQPVQTPCLQLINTLLIINASLKKFQENSKSLCAIPKPGYGLPQRKGYKLYIFIITTVAFLA